MTASKLIACEIFHRTRSSIDIPVVMARKVRLEQGCLQLPGSQVEIDKFTRVFVVAIGKAAHALLAGLRNLLPPSLPATGVVAAPTLPPASWPGCDYFLCGHPLPNRASWLAGESILRLLQTADDRTLVFFLLSGGGSALAELPIDRSLTLEDVQGLYQALVTCGAPIEDMNTVRRHLSALKGGRLALAAAPATKITLAVSDVPVGKEFALASGPSLPDPTTVHDVQRVLSDYHLRAQLPAAVVRWIDAGRMPESPKPGDPGFARTHFELLLGMDDLFHAAHRAAEAHGYLCFCDNSTDDWPVEAAADSLLSQLQDWRKENLGRPVALIADGEVSSPVTGPGTGGRNSAFVLACVKKIAGRPITVLSAGTDGIDGNSPAAGAVADGTTLLRAHSLGLDPRSFFEQSNAYSFFSQLEDTIVTGPTGNNLRDLRILLAEP